MRLPREHQFCRSCFRRRACHYLAIKTAEYFDLTLIKFIYGGNYTKFLFKIKMF
jgi:formate dehydrogenase assembly factor FdhD